MAWYLSGPLVDSLAPLKAWRGTYCIVPMEAISKPSEREKRLSDVDSSGGEKSISIVQGLSRTVTAVDRGRGVKTGKTEKTARKDRTGSTGTGRQAACVCGHWEHNSSPPPPAFGRRMDLEGTSGQSCPPRTTVLQHLGTLPTGHVQFHCFSEPGHRSLSSPLCGRAPQWRHRGVFRHSGTGKQRPRLWHAMHHLLPSPHRLHSDLGPIHPTCSFPQHHPPTSPHPIPPRCSTPSAATTIWQDHHTSSGYACRMLHLRTLEPLPIATGLPRDLKLDRLQNHATPHHTAPHRTTTTTTQPATPNPYVRIRGEETQSDLRPTCLRSPRYFVSIHFALDHDTSCNYG